MGKHLRNSHLIFYETFPEQCQKGAEITLEGDTFRVVQKCILHPLFHPYAALMKEPLKTTFFVF